MTGIAILALLSMLALMLYSAREAFAEQQAIVWAAQHGFNRAWVGAVGLTPVPQRLNRMQTSTLLHIVLSETPRNILVLEVHESFPALEPVAQKHVVIHCLRLEGYKGLYDRFYTCRDLFIH